jgi:hypothetical protein
MDVWSDGLQDLSPTYEIIPLEDKTMNALGYQIAGASSWFQPTSPASLFKLQQEIELRIRHIGKPAHVRLTSRSPKDSPRARSKGMAVHNANDALALFLSGSLRCANDLKLALIHNSNLGFVVRKWLDFPIWAEFRVYRLGREWQGVSQAMHLESEVFTEIERNVPELRQLLPTFLRELNQAGIPDDAVFDIAYLPEFRIFRVLDLNPWGNRTDFALFERARQLDGSFRFRTDQGIKAVEIFQ